MEIVAIYGSPRKGNTDRMLDAFLEGIPGAGTAVEKIFVRDLDIQGCLGCGGCDETGRCVVEDQMQDLYPLLEGAHGIVVASPIYFYNITGQLKLLVDRCQALFMKKILRSRETPKAASEPVKQGFLLSSAATYGRRLFDCARLTMRYFMDALEGEMVGDLCLRGLEGRKDVERTPGALERCREAGRLFAEGLRNLPGA